MKFFEKVNHLHFSVILPNNRYIGKILPQACHNSILRSEWMSYAH